MNNNAAMNRAILAGARRGERVGALARLAGVPPLDTDTPRQERLNRLLAEREDAMRRGDEDAYMLCNRSWEMPLHHGQPDFRHPDHLLPRGEVRVRVTVRGDDLTDSVFEFGIRPLDGTWEPYANGR